MAAAHVAFSPALSHASAEKVSMFAVAPISEDLKTVPGVGDAMLAALEAKDITTPHQLIGAFMGLRSKGISRKDHLQRFFDFLLPITGRRDFAASIVVGIATKCNNMMPGLFVAEEY